MKLIACVLLAVLAVAAGDEGFYQQQEFASAPADTYSNYNNYYDQQPPRQKGLWERLFGNTRRQDGGFLGLGGLLGGAGAGAGAGGLGIVGPLLLFSLVIGALILAVAGAYFVVTQLNNSGRGLENDEWEIDHSVWMDQLQKDFEDSWKEE